MEKIELNLTEPPATTTTTINIKSSIEGKKAIHATPAKLYKLKQKIITRPRMQQSVSRPTIHPSNQRTSEPNDRATNGQIFSDQAFCNRQPDAIYTIIINNLPRLHDWPDQTTAQHHRQQEQIQASSYVSTASRSTIALIQAGLTFLHYAMEHYGRNF